MTKDFRKVGMASGSYTEFNEAVRHSQIQINGRYHLAETPLDISLNPFIDNCYNAKSILDLGCGTGRNARWVWENTAASYTGLDPNRDMLKFFWELNKDYLYKKPYTVLTPEFSGLTDVYDVVISTFVLQHIFYHDFAGVMNVDDITQSILPRTHKQTVWFLVEHDWEQDGWIEKWISNNKFKLYASENSKNIYKFPDHRVMILKNESV